MTPFYGILNPQKCIYHKAISMAITILKVSSHMPEKELINEVCGSLFGPGPHRLEAAAERGIPQILSLSCVLVDFCSQIRHVHYQ
jgi:uncharacterized protein (UPF0261 family)